MEQFKLRMPPELKITLAALAATNRRSLNAEIIILLESSLHGKKKKADAAVTASA